MPVTVVVGGQYGSEGKGKVAAWLAENRNAVAAVRCGGPNSGHTVYDSDGGKWVFRQLPTMAIHDTGVCILPAGGYIDTEIFLEEIRSSGLTADRVMIDPYCCVITDQDKRNERKSGLGEKIASTNSGIGAAIKARASRDGPMVFARDIPELLPFVRDTKESMDKLLRAGERLVVEGTQGFGLSLLHSGEYPYVTARDTIASSFISECGISPIDVDQIVMVIRAFPIRVGGNSGPLNRETSWPDLCRRNGLCEGYAEYTTVTNKVRRVAEFDSGIVKRAIMANRPTEIVMNHLDYVSEELRNRFVEDVNKDIEQNINWIGLGPRDVVEASNAYSELMSVKDFYYG